MKTYLSLILACYNEGEHLEKSFMRIYAVLKKLKQPYEIIFIEDKSKDNTLAIIEKIIRDYRKKVEFRLVKHTRNKGRGKSVVDGIQSSRGEVVGYLDVDLEVGPEYILKALSLIGKSDLIVGNREFPFYLKTIHRYLASKIYAFLARIILSLPVQDSEAGFKFFKRKKVLQVLPYVKNNGWFWDTEVVAVAKLLKLKIAELPVKYVRRTDKTSTVNILKDSVIYFWNLIEFRVKYIKSGSRFRRGHHLRYESTK